MYAYRMAGISDNPFSTSQLDLFRKTVEKKEGSIAIYTECAKILTCVRVTDIVGDDWGVRLKVTCEPRSGLTFRGENNFHSATIGSSWHFLGLTEGQWHAPYAWWQLIFNPEVIEKASQAAERELREGKPFNVYGALACVRYYQYYQPKK